MRLRSGSAESVGFMQNFRPTQSGGAAAGRRFKLPKFFRGNGGPTPASTSPTTDGQVAVLEEEPREVIVTFEEHLDALHFSEASRLLIQAEELLLGENNEAEARNEKEVNKLAADYETLEALVLQTLSQSLSGEINIEALTSAVKAISQEMEQDQLWRQRDRKPPAWRHTSWKKRHDSTLRCLVELRMDNPSTPIAENGRRSSIQTDVTSMGRQLKDDLLRVVDVVKRCYPPKLDICHLYAKLYHESFSARLRKIAEFVLSDSDCMILLRWVNEFYPELLQKPELAAEIDTEPLGKLLPKELVEPLEEQYLNKQKDELTTYVGRVLKEAKERWDKGEMPEKEDGCFVGTVAYDVIQLINGMVTSAERVVGDRRRAQNITCQLKDFIERFRSFHNDIIKQNKPNSKPFVKANLGCIEQFSDVLQKKSHLFPNDVREICLLVLPDMKQTAHAYLLKPIHEALKPHYRKLGTSDWLNKSTFKKLLDGIKEELQDLHGSTESCHQKLTDQLYEEVTVEYVKRLLRGDKLKDKELQLKAYNTMRDNAESLHRLFASMGSTEEWLKEILTTIAEVLKLQDLPAIQMQVVSLGSAYPDLSEKHVSALLKLKTNLSKADRKNVKETLTDALKEPSCVATRPFFSAVEVR
ncbi:Tumor necrosis factor alpha-induced protein 2 [Nibea albiflora]|uniref:Tumor necrosis factor alpha-induced protein 2 n=1 Tax=Nibea albiflora TaxID=240163 RepID=A0ACB7FFJ0_NIBAL|nr:Tumor necrosis factor alpha-induced protein 2 [Nibea albiflora]